MEIPGMPSARLRAIDHQTTEARMSGRLEYFFDGHRGLRIATVMLAILAMAAQSTVARAEFPDRAIKIVVPFAAGGGTDIIARTLAQEMAGDLKGTVIIDNRP